MENASNALIIAGGVLIGVLILSLAVYLFASFGEDAENIHSLIETNQLQQYNAQFNVYVGRTDITIYDIVSLANLAKEINESNKGFSDYETAYKIQVLLEKEGYLESLSEDVLQSLIQNYNKIIEVEGEQKGELASRFTGVLAEYHTNGRVKSIRFRHN